MNFTDFSAQDGSENDPKLTQDCSKTVPKADIFHVEFWLQFWFILGSILNSFGAPFGPQNRSKIDPKNYQKSSCASIPPRDRLKRPQDHPQRPQDPPKRLQDRPKRLPRPSQEALRDPQGLPKPLQEAPILPQRP